VKRSTPLRRTAFKRQAKPLKVVERDPGPMPVVTVMERPRAKVAALLSAEVPRPMPKEITFRSDAWLAAVRALPCVKCGRPAEAAHRNEAKGMGIKADDALTAALCREHHAEIDQGRHMTREERRAEIDRCIVLTVRELARAGRIVVK
jgi:hypothetical protein